jgi:hypothetical protein
MYTLHRIVVPASLCPVCWSRLNLHATQVSAHRRCIVRLSILAKGAGSNDYFKVNGIAVVPYAQPARLNWVESAVIAREQLFNDAYRVALVPKASAMGVEHDEAPVQQSFSRRPYVAGASGPGY